MKLIDTKDVVTIVEPAAEHEAKIVLFIEQVSARIETFLNRKLKLEERIEHYDRGENFLALPAYPVLKPDTADAWKASTAYVVGDYVRPTTANDHLYKCTVAGTSHSSEPTWPTNGTTVADNTVTWEDQGSGLTVNVTDVEQIKDGDFYLNANLGTIEFYSSTGSYRPGEIDVTWIGGYKEINGILAVPDDIKRACLMQVSFDFMRRNDLGLSAVSMPDGSISTYQPARLLPEVQTILISHKRMLVR